MKPGTRELFRAAVRGDNTLTASQNIAYRPDIDGMRAVAVIAVMLFHGGLSGFEGGFLGVDVFFVISGYLITNILLREIDGDQFSLLKFYERRIRRIFPALAFVVMCTLPFAFWLMLPQQLIDYGESIVSVALFSSNILFWSESGYFSHAAEIKPMLHTWSLAVEEQFYVFFPLLLILVRNTRLLVFAIVALWLLSFTLCVVGSLNFPSASFYLFPTRAWELLTGCLCSIIVRYGLVSNSGPASSAGLGAILLSIALFHESDRLPSHLSLVPVIGTASVLLFSGPGTLTYRLLSMTPVVGVGLISYSAYLWHQPIFAFARILYPAQPLNVAWILTLLGASMVLAYLSWRFVETPFRRRAAEGVSARSIFTGFAATSMLIVSIGITIVALNGFPARVPETVRLAELVSSPVRTNCPLEVGGDSACVIGEGDVEPSIAIVGDSHANRWAAIMEPDLMKQGRAAFVHTMGMCPPVYFEAEPSVLPLVTANCAGMMREVVDSLVSRDQIGVVILAAEWPLYTTGYRETGFGKRQYAFAFGQSRVSPRMVAKVTEGLERAVTLLEQADIRVLLLFSVPEYDFDVPSAVVASHMHGTEISKLKMSMSQFRNRNTQATAMIEAISARHPIDVIYPHHELCDETYCYPYNADAMPLYNDSNHLVPLGGAVIARDILERVERLLTHGS